MLAQARVFMKSMVWCVRGWTIPPALVISLVAAIVPIKTIEYCANTQIKAS